ncbi:MAG: cytochrome c oxidase assembly protein [Alphaproteobacteria bacterium]
MSDPNSPEQENAAPRKPAQSLTPQDMAARPSDAELVRRNARTGLIVLSVVIGMMTLAFASVPLYRLFCQVTGFGGTPMTSAALPDRVIEDRQVTIRFNADTGRNMPWDFRSELREVVINPGARGIASFSAHNRTRSPVSGTAVYNVTPLKVGKYFHKIQCFCFDLQTLNPNESVDMPVLFYIDPAFNDDPYMNDVTTITLSYTFFRAESEELESALEAFYNQKSDDI